MTLRAGGVLAGLRPLTSACVLLLFLLLPALVAGARLDSPARPGELRRVEEALDPSAATNSPVARMYYGMTLPAEPAGDAVQSLALARRAQLLGVLGLSFLLYLSVRMVRSRLVAIAACLALAVLPPVFADGYVLRPETPAALFALLAVLLLQGLPRMSRSRPRSWHLGLLSQLATMSSVGMCLALAASALTTYAVVFLLLPAATLFLAVLTWGLRLPRVARHRGLARMPVRAFALRLGPWVGTAFFTLFFSWLLFSSELGPSSVPHVSTATSAGIYPEPFFLWLPTVILTVLGALSLVLRTGVDLGRTARLSPAAVLLVFVAIMLVDRLLHGEGVDGLAAALALAVLIAEGLRVVVVFGAPAVWPRPRPQGRRGGG